MVTPFLFLFIKLVTYRTFSTNPQTNRKKKEFAQAGILTLETTIDNEPLEGELFDE